MKRLSLLALAIAAVLVLLQETGAAVGVMIVLAVLWVSRGAPR